MKKVFIAAWSIILLSACSPKKYTREEALRLITTTYGFPVKIQRTFYSGLYNMTSNTPNLTIREIIEGNKAKGELRLFDEGYRTIERAGEYTKQVDMYTLVYHTGVRIGFSEKAKPDILSEEFLDPNEANIKKQMISIGEYLIDNIKSFRVVSDSECEIEFTLKMGIHVPYHSAFAEGILMPKGSPHEYLPAGIENVTFKQRIIKYDDGWRVATDDEKALQKSMGIRSN